MPVSLFSHGRDQLSSGSYCFAPPSTVALEALGQFSFNPSAFSVTSGYHWDAEDAHTCPPPVRCMLLTQVPVALTLYTWEK